MERISDQGRLRPWMGFVLFGILMAAFIVICAPLQLKFGTGGIVLTELIFAGIALIYCLVTRVKIREVFPVKKVTARDIFGCIFMMMGIFPLGIVCASLTAAVFPWASSEVTDLNKALYGDMSYIGCVLVICVLPAICEEMIHRGAILSNFRSLKHDWIIVLIMSIFFGINHCSVLRFLTTALLGAAFSYVMVKKNNILLTMMMHFGNNLISTTAGYFSNKLLGGQTQSAADISSYLGVYMIFAFTAPLFIVLGMMLLNKESHHKVRFLYAGIASAVILAAGIGLTYAGFAKSTILQSTIGYEVTEESPDCSMLTFDIDKERSATVVAVMTQGEGDYRIRIDGDKGSNIINAPVPQGDLRMISYDITLVPDHYTVTVDADDNAIGEVPNVQVMIR
ncbi:Membrane protease YdiL, CAAX protease family [Ruminococcaceae bacterium YRB3002]|nr:Membrane protease YdiL, CAAX protease family [Ruminococcaceae bacterium YRB3002]